MSTESNTHANPNAELNDRASHIPYHNEGIDVAQPCEKIGVESRGCQPWYNIIHETKRTWGNELIYGNIGRKQFCGPLFGDDPLSATRLRG